MKINAKEYINELNRELGGGFIYSIPLIDLSRKTLEAFTNTGLFSEEKLNQLREHSIQQSVGEAFDKLLANIELEIANEFNLLGYPLKIINYKRMQLNMYHYSVQYWIYKIGLLLVDQLCKSWER